MLSANKFCRALNQSDKRRVSEVLAAIERRSRRDAMGLFNDYPACICPLFRGHSRNFASTVNKMENRAADMPTRPTHCPLR